jgi:hypothetical protein
MTTNTGPKFNAINPSGTVRYGVNTWPWKYFSPNVRPDGGLVLVEADNQSVSTTANQVRGLNPLTGAVLWSIDLAQQGATNMSQMWASEFNADGSVAYIPTTGNNYGLEPWCYLYALITTDSGQLPSPPPPACYANCDGSTSAPVLNVADFTCFLTRFAAGDAWANCDGSTSPPALNVADFTCYLSTFAAGCR